jgi:hypothetical protein
MTVPYIDALLVRQADKSFRSEAVKLPSSRLGDAFRLTSDVREADGGVLAAPPDHKRKVYSSGQRRRVTETIKRELRPPLRGRAT